MRTPSEVKSFSEIRQNLNPCCSYIILEGEFGKHAAAEIRKAFDMLPLRTGDVLETQLYCEAQTRRHLLVARLARGRGELVKERILLRQIAPNLTLYYYGSSPEREQHDVQRL